MLRGNLKILQRRRDSPSGTSENSRDMIETWVAGEGKAIASDGFSPAARDLCFSRRTWLNDRLSLASAHKDTSRSSPRMRSIGGVNVVLHCLAPSASLYGTSCLGVSGSGLSILV